MQIGCAQMHPVTLAAIVIELIILGAQSALYFGRIHDRTTLGYLILLLFLLIFNVANGLLPDPSYAIPLYIQHIIVNTTGFMIVSYFPFYFYKVFGLVKLRFLAIYGVPLFLFLPYLTFFVVGLSIHEDVEFTHRYGYIVPTAYTLVLLVSIGRAIRFAYREHRNQKQYMEEIYFQWGQLVETLFTNLGFLGVSVLLLYRFVNIGRAEQQLIAGLELIPIKPEAIEKNAKIFGLSNREIEIVYLVCERMNYREIGEKLFISELTVKKHIQNIFGKVLVNSRSELVRKMNDA